MVQAQNAIAVAMGQARHGSFLQNNAGADVVHAQAAIVVTLECNASVDALQAQVAII